MAFCQYGGHDSSINPRKGGNLTPVRWTDNQTNLTLCWLVCDECKNKRRNGEGDNACRP
jgi:hypothetical protein